MEPEAQSLVQNWLIALGPWVLSGVVALLAWLGKRMIDKQDGLERITNSLDKGQVVLSKDVEQNKFNITRHEKWLQDHQEILQRVGGRDA